MAASGEWGREGEKERGRKVEREKGSQKQRERGMQRWENGRSKERDYGSEVPTEGRRGLEGKEDGGIETGAEREVKTERGQGRRKRGKDKRTNRGGTEGGMD